MRLLLKMLHHSLNYMPAMVGGATGALVYGRDTVGWHGGRAVVAILVGLLASIACSFVLTVTQLEVGRRLALQIAAEKKAAQEALKD